MKKLTLLLLLSFMLPLCAMDGDGWSDGEEGALDKKASKEYLDKVACMAKGEEESEGEESEDDAREEGSASPYATPKKSVGSDAGSVETPIAGVMGMTPKSVLRPNSAEELTPASSGEEVESRLPRMRSCSVSNEVAPIISSPSPGQATSGIETEERAVNDISPVPSGEKEEEESGSSRVVSDEEYISQEADKGSDVKGEASVATAEHSSEDESGSASPSGDEQKDNEYNPEVEENGAAELTSGSSDEDESGDENDRIGDLDKPVDSQPSKEARKEALLGRFNKLSKMTGLLGGSLKGVRTLIEKEDDFSLGLAAQQLDKLENFEKWWQRLLLPVGGTAGVLFAGISTHRHVRTCRAQGKPTIFERGWRASKRVGTRMRSAVFRTKSA